jgi:purine catabolism regulator
VELGSSWREVPAPVVAACARAGVPVVAFHRPVRFIEITEAVHSAVVNAQFALLARGEEIHRRFTELILQGRGVPEILAELTAAVGNPVVLEDASGSLVYYVSGHHGDDLALSAWADVHRAEDRGETAEGMFAVDVRLLDSSWGRLLALAIENPLDDFDRVAVERAAIAVALGLAGGARGTLLPIVATWRAPSFARRRSVGEPGEARVADGITWTRLSGDLRTALSSTGFAVLLGPRDVDLLILLALGQRGYDAALAEHVAHLFHGALDRHGLGPDDAALAIGAPADTWVTAGQGLRRVRRSAGAATALPVARWHDARRPGLADLLHDLRDTPELDAFVQEQLGPLLDDATPRAKALLDTLEAYLAAGGRKAEAARALHLERQSLYLRLRRIEEALGVSLDDEDVVLGLHLAVRALRFRRRR